MWIILFNVTLVTVLAIISSLSAAVASTTIAGPLMIDQTGSIWLSTGYLAAVGICLPLSGWLGKCYGARFAFLLGLAIFVGASLAAALAPNFPVMLTFRFVEGAGAGIIFPISLTIIQRAFPKTMVVLALSIYVGCGFGIGMILGVLVGGFVGQYMTWPWIFWINVMLGAPSLILTWFFHQETEKEKTPFDLIGYLFFAGFLCSCLLLVTNVKAEWNTKAWSSSFARTFIIVGIVSFILLIIRELRFQNPLIILRLFKQRHFTIGCVALLLIGSLLFGTATTFPAIFEGQLGYQKWEVGLLLMSFGLVLGPVGALVGFITKYINIRYLTVFGLLFLCASCFVQERIITIQSEHWQWTLVLVMRSLGLALSLGPVTSLALVDVAPQDMTCASMLVTFCRQMGGAIGGALVSLIAVYRAEYHNQIYGANVNLQSVAFRNYSEAFAERFQTMSGYSGGEAAKLAKVVIINNVKAQSQISAINDAFFILGCIMVGITVIITVVVIDTMWRQRAAKH